MSEENHFVAGVNFSEDIPRTTALLLTAVETKHGNKWMNSIRQGLNALLQNCSQLSGKRQIVLGAKTGCALNGLSFKVVTRKHRNRHRGEDGLRPEWVVVQSSN